MGMAESGEYSFCDHLIEITKLPQRTSYSREVGEGRGEGTTTTTMMTKPSFPFPQNHGQPDHVCIYLVCIHNPIPSPPSPPPPISLLIPPSPVLLKSKMERERKPNQSKKEAFPANVVRQWLSGYTKSTQRSSDCDCQTN